VQITRSDTAKGPRDWFTGDVYIDPVAAAPSPSRVQANLVHLAINEADGEHDAVRWMTPVTDEEYAAAPPVDD
jgi:hypothetical protein